MPDILAVDEAKSRVRAAVEANRDAVIDVSRRIHADPEIGLQETRAARLLVDRIGAATGVEATLGLGSLPTAFRAEVGSGELVVTLCAEYDALPEIGHGCGHNIIAASAFGAFTALAPIADDLGITVRLLGTPAEENAGGKVTLLDEGAFDGTHAALMVHPGPEDSIEMNPYASGGIQIEFTGREAHASAAPHDGVNALDAMTIMLTAIGLARQQLEPSQQIHGIVQHGGAAPNVIPGSAGGVWMGRAATAEALERVIAVIRRCAEAGAHATGAAVTLTEGPFRYLDLRTDAGLNVAYAANLESVGRVAGVPMPRGGSTDMGNVSHRFPCIHPVIGLGDPVAVPHTPGFAALAGSEPGDRAAVDGATLLASTVVDAAVDKALRVRLLTGSDS
ncbi:amidohydrolase [Saccharopolyspora shandongensis]|uniref:amidohydrolase n=1 Tax=Saccharopolyspora shandongensis TaxID=418495 RepID=UPI0033DC0422